ncbi:MAG TPA: electron transfer flavoprotein subunit beta/FixA family protein [Terriglobia bacterium]|nr:electron transfer flavoprotein subunit beta/FixA family protein [Terriglobia bacterium]
MRLLVCLKQVPEKNSQFRLKADSSWIEEQDLTYETNECDLYALEEALRLQEQHGGEVVVLSAGDDRVTKVIKHGLAMGADRAIHLKTLEPGVGDPDFTARLIAKALVNQSFDMVFTGVQSDDLGFAQTGPILAYVLGYPYATIVVEVRVHEDQKSIQVKRELESGLFERLELPLPAVLSIQSGISEPRYPTLKGIMQAKKKEITSMTPSDLGFRAEEMGWQGSRIVPNRLSVPEKKKRTVMLEGSEEEMVRDLVERLRREAKVL